MKTKAIVFLSSLVLALGLIAQAAMQSTPATTDTAKTCACCNHDADGKVSCCGKDNKCAKEGCCGKDGGCCEGKDGKKCPMMSKMSDSKDGKMSCCSGKDNKCPMMSKTSKGEGKGCCGGKCDRSQAGM